MTKKEEKNLELIKKIYKPSKLQMRWVNFIKKLLEQKGVNVSYAEKSIKISGLYLKGVYLEDTHSQVRVEWFPDYTISTNSNPFCSAYMLNVRELRLLYNVLEKTLNQ